MKSGWLIVTALLFGVATARAAEPAVLSSVDEFQANTGDFGPRETMPGAALYADHCAHCHSGRVPKAPQTMWLEMMSPQAVLKAMNEGVMQPQAGLLSSAERVHVAEYLTRRRATTAETVPHAPACTGATTFAADRPPIQAGWGHDTARHVTAAQAGFTADQIGGLQLRWAFAYPGALRARSQPAIGFGAVFTGSQDGHVYAFDLAAGCERWSYDAGGEVRTGIVLALVEGRPLAVFGDLLARLHVVDARTGKRVWVRRMDDHPSATLTGTPALVDNRLYVPVSSLEVTPAADPAYPCCSFRGKVVALQAATGDEVWTHYTIPQAPVETGRRSGPVQPSTATNACCTSALARTTPRRPTPTAMPSWR